MVDSVRQTPIIIHTVSFRTKAITVHKINKNNDDNEKIKKSFLSI